MYLYLREDDTCKSCEIILAAKSVEFNVYVKTQTGKIFTFKLKTHHTIDYLKAQIADIHGVPSKLQCLSFKGGLLADEIKVSDFPEG